MHCLVIAHLFLSSLDSAIQTAVKFLQRLGCIFVVSLAVNVLVAYVPLPHYICTGDGSCRLCTMDWKGCPRSEKGGQKQIHPI